ncbi:transposase [Fulvivirga sp. RKSG066]|uniref:REP-associated tyrosine transposase n=1 Tax=Fulvivirga aurantia TaxID=2529383 RepID=UPI0012BBFC5A|nr:transposase [Fulvivirga aurantia]MTI19870.1 transposase [Fulvivirga aurantia]
MGRKYAIRDQQALHFVTFTVVNWIDLFIRDEYKQIIVDSLDYCIENKNLNVHAYCIMTSHVHLILSVNHSGNLSHVIRDFKSFTSTSLKNATKENSVESRKEWLLWMMERAGKKNSRNSGFQFWQQHNHPIQLDTNELMDQRLEYVHNNPCEAGFVDDPCAWTWSSCSSYQRGVASPIPLVYIE